MHVIAARECVGHAILIVMSSDRDREGPSWSVGVVEWFNQEEGFGALVAPEVLAAVSCTTPTSSRTDIGH